MARPKTNGIRITLSVEELQNFYAYLGGRIGAIQDGGAIMDQRPSEYASQVADVRRLQDKIAAAIREHQVAEAEAVAAADRPLLAEAK